MGLISRHYWKLRLRGWPADAGRRTGYSLLLPVPGDLPVFTDLGLEVCASMSAKFRVETLVIPDQPSPCIGRIVASRESAWTGPLRIIHLPRPERELLRRRPNPFLYYGLQYVTGVKASEATHLLLHDADL